MENIIKRKVRQSGNSIVVTLPESVLKQLHVEKGDTVQFESIEGRVQIVKATDIQSINPRVIELANSIFTRNEETFKALVER